MFLVIDAQILETTYFDICTIKRKEKAKDPNTGVTTTKEVTISKDVKCALSKKDSQVMNQTEVGNLSYTHLLFVGPNTDILAGDIVDVTSTNGNWGYTKYGWICLDYTIYQDKLTTEFYDNVNYNTGNYYVTATRGLNVRKSPNTNSTILYAISKGTDFSVTEVDGSWGYSPEMGGWLCLNYAEWLSDLEPEIPVPETPILTTKTSSVIGVGEIISVEWEKVDFTDSYTLKLIDTKNKNVVETKSGVTGTTASFVAPYEGCYDVSIVAVNSKHTSTESRIYNITAQAPSTVTFKNWDGSIISTQNVAYGKDATVPATPSREGYTFSKWDGDLKKVQEDRTITATYTRNKYKVTFCDYDGTFISTQDVYYGDAATAPKYSAPTGL